MMRSSTLFSYCQGARWSGVRRTVATASRGARNVSTSAPRRRSRRTAAEAASSSVPPSRRRSVRLGGWGCIEDITQATAYAARLVGAW